MRKHPNPEVESAITLRLWTYAEAVKALPYLRALVRSLRERWLHLQGVRREVAHLEARPGRPDRQALILRADAAREAELAGDSFHETLGELKALDVHSLDPARGLALIPFRWGDQLAWFAFDLFAPQGLDAWRFHTDALETRRPLPESLDPALVDAIFSAGAPDVAVPG
jgi:hypothetical protein